MPYTVWGAFDMFRQRLELTELQQSTVSTRQRGVRACLDERLSVVRDLLGGSYARDTMIRPPDDIDLFVVLNTNVHARDFYPAGGSTGALEATRRVLADCYTSTKIRRDGQAVTIRFTDFGFDVVPAFPRQGVGLWIPDGAGTWLATNPEGHARFMTVANTASAGQLKPLVKMLKAWNRVQWNDFFESFHLEMVAREIFNQQPLVDYPRGIAQFFWSAEISIQHSFSDPAGLSGQIDTYLNAPDQRNLAHRIIKLTETVTQRAVEIGAISEEQGIGAWRDLFGGEFPTYG